jgi:hypothetical protein
MKKILIEETFQSPRITIDPEKNIFEIRGNSFPNNALRLYTPVVEWLDEYSKSPNPETVFVFRISYQNSSSRKMFNEILKRLERMVQKGHNVRIDWYYDQNDDDLKQVILEFKHLFKAVPIKEIPVKE